MATAAMLVAGAAEDEQVRRLGVFMVAVGVVGGPDVIPVELRRAPIGMAGSAFWSAAHAAALRREKDGTERFVGKWLWHARFPECREGSRPAHPAGPNGVLT